MRKIAICLLFLGASLLGNATAQEKKTAKDQDLLQGTWKGFISKKSSFTAPVEGNVVRLEGDLVERMPRDEYGNSGGFRAYKFTLNENVAPKRIDLKSSSGKFKGIYELHGDTLILCVCWSENGERPTDFFMFDVDGDTNAAAVTLVLKRQSLKGK